MKISVEKKKKKKREFENLKRIAWIFLNQLGFLKILSKITTELNPPYYFTLTNWTIEKPLGRKWNDKKSSFHNAWEQRHNIPRYQRTLCGSLK